MLVPVLEELAAKFKNIKFARINVDENKELSNKFKIFPYNLELVSLF